jgi:putative DNA primase/helicase
MIALDALAGEPRWVAWRNEPRGGKPTKVPYATDGKKAKADDPATWGTRAEAEASAARLVNEGSGGVGIQLGDLGNDVHLAGIDLDCCLGVDGVFAGWASAILDTVPSYAEVSPSGRGLKLFFFVASENVRWFLDSIGADRGQWGVRRGVPGEDARDHGPAIEVYFSHRYFTVTDRRWAASSDRLVMLDHAALERLALLIPPAQSGAGRSVKGRAGDNSRSAIAFRRGAAPRRAGATFDEMCAALRADPETAPWVREKGDAYGGRELRRIWDKEGGHGSAPISGGTDHDPRLAAQLTKFLRNDIGNAQRFVERFGDDARFIVSIGWFVWDGRRWKRDEGDIAVRRLAQRVARAIFHEVPFAGDADQQKARVKWALQSGYSARLTCNSLDLI